MLKKMLVMGIVPLACIILFGALEALGALDPVEHRFYDFTLALRPAVPEHPALLFVNVDDEALEQSRTLWPWPRDNMAEGLFVMAEFGASRAVFDILYDQPSAPGVNLSRYAGVESEYNRVFLDLESDFLGLAQALADGDLKLRDLKSYAAGLYIEELSSAKESLLGNIDALTLDRDAALGRAARAFGSAFVAVNVAEDDRGRVGGTDKTLLAKVFREGALVGGTKLKPAPDLVLPVPPILAGARGAGSIRISPDQPDGVMRRIDLFYNHDGRLVPQLGMAALLDYLGAPALEIAADRVVVKGAVFPDSGKQTDVVIPLAEDGTMLVNWSKRPPERAFRQISFWALLEYGRVEADMLAYLERLDAYEKAGRLRVVDGVGDFFNEYVVPVREMKRALEAGGEGVDIALYRERKTAFAEGLARVLAADREDALVNGIRTRDGKERRELEADIRAVYAKCRDGLLPQYRKLRERLAQELKDSICVTGLTAATTTDIGVTPFSGEYPNVGMHVNVMNTVLARQFLDDAPPATAVVLTAIFTLLVYGLAFGIKHPLASVLAGAGALLACAAGLLVFFMVSGVYPGLVAPAAAPLVVFIVFTVLNFLRTAKEKNFIRNAFTRYVSKEVISELIADPSKLNLGGEQKRLTALFTDIKGFSGFSELLTPPELVRLLNSYFTDMGDIILGLSGTLDKYVGDAIVSFFGAPIALPGHARHACLAAVRMKKTEARLNERIAEQKLSPKPLFTRIGINTGDMLVGNMGSQDKLNYTIMGHHVNLASRLEGVNKKYGTWILMSENTHRDAGQGFLTRKLDRVRVVGINAPVRLYELIDEKAEARPELFEVVDIFHAGLEAFEKRKWEEAKGRFREALKLRPDDGPAAIYLKRCQDFKKKPPAANWDGVFSLMEK